MKHVARGRARHGPGAVNTLGLVRFCSVTTLAASIEEGEGDIGGSQGEEGEKEENGSGEDEGNDPPEGGVGDGACKQEEESSSGLGSGQPGGNLALEPQLWDQVGGSCYAMTKTRSEWECGERNSCATTAGGGTHALTLLTSPHTSSHAHTQPRTLLNDTHPLSSLFPRQRQWRRSIKGSSASKHPRRHSLPPPTREHVSSATCAKGVAESHQSIDRSR